MLAVLVVLVPRLPCVVVVAVVVVLALLVPCVLVFGALRVFVLAARRGRTVGDRPGVGGSARVRACRTDPPQSVVLALGVESEWWRISSQPVRTALPITNAAAAVRSARRQRIGLPSVRSSRLVRAVFLGCRRSRATWLRRWVGR